MPMAELAAAVVVAAASSSCSFEAKIPVVAAVVIMPCKLPEHPLAAVVEAAIVAVAVAIATLGRDSLQLAAVAAVVGAAVAMTWPQLVVVVAAAFGPVVAAAVAFAVVVASAAARIVLIAAADEVAWPLLHSTMLPIMLEVVDKTWLVAAVVGG